MGRNRLFYKAGTNIGQDTSGEIEIGTRIINFDLNQIAIHLDMIMYLNMYYWI